MEIEVESNKIEGGGDTSPGCSGYSGMVHSKKVIKHALRQQAKRRRKNTTIAAGNSRTLPRIVVKPLPPPPPNEPPSPPAPQVQHVNTVEEPAATMREVLASLPGFSLKSGRRRSTKRLSAAAQLEAGLVDLETPASILASTSLRALLNRHTFQGLPPLYQRKLAQLLPAVDRQDAATSGLNNEFFARACLEWRKRLAEGEFTPENQQRLKMEAERDKNKLDPWKLKHFEPIWGDKREPKLRLGLHCIPETRQGGAVTRSSLRLRLESNAEQIASDVYCRSSSVATEKTTADNSDDVTDVSQTSVKTVENGPEEARVDSLPVYDDAPDPSPEIIQDRLEANENVINAEETTLEDPSTVDYRHEEQQTPEDTTLNSRESEIFMETKECDTREKQSMQIDEPLAELPNDEILAADEIMEIPETSMNHETNDPMEAQITSVSDLQIERTNELSADPIDVISVALSHVDDDSQVIPVTNEEEHRPHREPSDHQHHHQNESHDSHLLDADETKIYEISECENAAAVESISGHEEVETTDRFTDEHNVTSQIVDNQHDTSINPSVAESEPQIPECMEIDSETLQRIHELEVRGEMREAYEEISGCPEEIIYPILSSMEMTTRPVAEETENQTVVVAETVVVEDVNEQPDVMNVVNVDDELRDANNYVCSEMLECSWPVDATVNAAVDNNNSNINNSPVQEDLQVPWPLVAAALDGTVAANITVTTQDDCNETATSNSDVAIPTTSSNPSQAVQQQTQFVTASETNPESLNCIQLPVVQGVTSYQPAETSMTLNSASNASVAVSLMKTVQSASPPIIAFPSLQSIRFVQTRFHHGQQNSVQGNMSGTNNLTAQIPSQHNQTTHQVSIVRPSEEIVQLATVANSQQQQQQQHQNSNIVARGNLTNNITVRNAVQANVVQATVGLPSQVHQQSAIVVQHQTPIVTGPSRQIVASMQPQQYSSGVVPTRTSRGSGQGSYRAARNSNKEQGGGRSRSSTKEPPGAVNLERSYQICQAVIQSSPNRDQLKAHLKPPPSLLARGDGAFTTSKTGGRTITTVKTQKANSQHGKQTQNKTQAVMLRQVFATARQPAPVEVADSNAVAQLSSNGTGGFGQYILVQRTGVSDGAPRASSAPPLPPQIAGIGVGVHLVRGRPASAGEGSHQAVTLKARGTTDGRGSGGAEPGAPGVIMGGDPPPPCECNMRGAMVICRQCGAFCHDDCIGPQRICATCLIR